MTGTPSDPSCVDPLRAHCGLNCVVIASSIHLHLMWDTKGANNAGAQGRG